MYKDKHQQESGCYLTIALIITVILIIQQSKNKTMYRQQQPTKNKVKTNQSYVGDSLEIKILRMTQNKEPIKDGAPLSYSDRSQGVQPAYNIRTDRFEIALEATDSITKGRRARREKKFGEQANDNMKTEDKNSKPDKAGDASGGEGKA